MHLRIHKGVPQPCTISLGKGLLVGRRPDCGLVVDDPGVSWQHARFARKGNGYWLADLGSANGTELDGVRLEPRQWAKLPGEAVLHFGRIAAEITRPVPQGVRDYSQACSSLLPTVEGGRACGVIDLRARRWLALRHVLSELGRDERKVMATTCIELFCGAGLRQLDRTLSGRPFGCPEALLLHSAHLSYFLKSLPQRALLVVLVVERTTNSGRAQLKLGELVRRIERAHASDGSVAPPSIPRQQTLARVLEQRPRSISPARSSFHGRGGTTSVTGVLQLLSQQRKTGVLELCHAALRLKVAFESGSIAAAWSPGNDPEEGLVDLLLRRREVSKSDVRLAKAEQRRTGVPVVRCLQASGRLNRGQLENALDDLVSERILTALTWSDMRYTFSEQLPPALELETRLEVGPLMMKAAMEADELPRLRKTFPNDNLEVSPRAPADGASAHGLPTPQSRLLQRLPVSATPLHQIFQLSPWDAFTSLKLLHALHAAGRLDLHVSKAL